MKLFQSPISINYLEINKDEIFTQLKIYIKNLEKKILSQELEIESLQTINFTLEKEKIKLSSSLFLKENTIRDITLILDNLKYKNDQNENKINYFEKENQELNYKNVELTQKNKTLMNTQINNNINNEIHYLREQLSELSIIKSKLEFDNKNLVNKINEIQNEHENEITMLTKIKNSEISQQNKIILILQNGINSLNNYNNNNEINLSNNINVQYSDIIFEEINELEKKTKVISKENIELKRLINELEKKKEEYENIIISKEKIIKKLENQSKEFEENLIFKNKELNLSSEENLSVVKETINSIDQLIFERDDLLKQNNNLRFAYEYFNNGVKEANDLFFDKVKYFESILFSLNEKIKNLNDKNIKLIEENSKLKGENDLLKKENERINKEKLSLKNNSTNLDYNDNMNLQNNQNKYNNNLRGSNNNYQKSNIPRNNNLNNLNSNIFRNSNNSNSINNNLNSLNNVNNLNFDINDPFEDDQLKAVQEFRNVLIKAEHNLNKDKISLGQE